jgi:L-ascorbate metabolism protein UlaG (beta-lactamase superfamily)
MLIVTIPLAIVGCMGAVLFLAWLFSPKKSGGLRYLAKDSAKTYKTPPGWKGTPVDAKGRFMNCEFPFYQNYAEILWWIPSHAINLIQNRKVRTPFQTPNPDQLFTYGNHLVWLGHASYLVQLEGKKILIDPVFHDVAFYKRHHGNPIDPARFTNIDLILLSHDHMDHCDQRSLRQLVDQNPDITILTGLNMDKLLRSLMGKEVRIECADWWQQYSVQGPLSIFFVPSRHYAKRPGQPFNGSLWGGFVIQYGQRTLYFGGDSGYGNHYRDIGQVFWPDTSILGIGAYEPEWFMSPNHQSPAHALQAMKDLGTRQMIPMHYGTYNLSSEHMDTAVQELRAHPAFHSGCRILEVGEILSLR